MGLMTRDDAVAAIVSLGGQVGWASEMSLSSWEYADLPDPPKRGVTWLGKRREDDTVVYAELTSDEQLRYLPHIPDVRVLCLWNSTVSNNGLRYCEGLSNLRRLHLAHSQITDQGLLYLQHMHDLKWLDLADTAITDEGIAYLAPLKQLEYLELEGTAISDKALEPLGAIAEMDELVVSRTNITGHCLSNLASLQRLTALDLRESRVLDETLAVVKWPPNLRCLNLGNTLAGNAAMRNLPTGIQSLNLFGTKVTDESLDVLVKASSLKEITLSKTGMTREAKIELAQNHPHLGLEHVLRP